MPLLLDTLAGASSAQGTCAYRRLGANIDVPGYDLRNTAVPRTVDACAKACCADERCAGALFERASTLTYKQCKVDLPCCFMKTSVQYPQPMQLPPPKGSMLLVIPGRRSRDDSRVTAPEDILPPQQQLASRATIGAEMARDEERISALIKEYKCTAAYLDVGTNTGMQIRKLYQPAAFPEAKVRPHFDAVFGPSHVPRCRVCAIGVEPNPRQADRLDTLERKLGNVGGAEPRTARPALPNCAHAYASPSRLARRLWVAACCRRASERSSCARRRGRPTACSACSLACAAAASTTRAPRPTG